MNNERDKPDIPNSETGHQTGEMSSETEVKREAVEQLAGQRLEEIVTATAKEKMELQETQDNLPTEESGARQEISELRESVGESADRATEKIDGAEGLPVKLERYDYIVSPDPTVRSKVDTFFDKNFFMISKEERGEGRELVDQMDFLQESATDWVKKELGIDPTARLPEKEKIALVSLQSLREKTQNPAIAGCANNLSREIILAEEMAEQLPYAFNHEVVHQLSAGRIKTRFDTQAGFLAKAESESMGYRTRTGKFLFFNEALTDLVNMEILQSVKDQHGQDYLQTKQLGYAPEAVLLDALIEKTGEASGQGDKFRKDLYRGLFTGDVEALRTIERHLGKGTLAQLADAQPQTYADLAKLGGRLRLDQEKLSKIYRRLRRGKKVELSNNISVSWEPHKER